MKKLDFLLLIIFIFLAAVIFPRNLYAVPFGNYLELFGGYAETITNNENNPVSVDFDIWVKPSEIKNYHPIISIGKNQHNFEVGINGGSLSLDVRFGTNSRKVITAGQIPQGVWSHIQVNVGYTSTSLAINGETVFSTSGTSPLKPLAGTVRLGKSVNSSNTSTFLGAIDEVQIAINGTQTEFTILASEQPYILWHLDEQRGASNATDGSSNGFNASLIGGDSKIHFFGVLPTATPRPTIGLIWNRPILPTLSRPGFFPTHSPEPTSFQPTSVQQPSPTDVRHPRPERSL